MPVNIKRIATILILLSTLLALAWWGLKDQIPARRAEGWTTINPPHEISALAVAGDIIWAGGRDGVYTIDRRQKKMLSRLESEPQLAYVKALLVDQNGDLWIGYEKGLICYNGREFLYYGTKDGLPHENVNALLLDDKGRLWVGTWGGAACWTGEKWQVYNQASGLAHDAVNVLFQDCYGSMWFGSYAAPEGGLTHYDGQQFTRFNSDNVLPHNNICSIYQDSANDLWVGTGFYTRGGAVRFSFENGKPVFKEEWTKKNGLAGEKVRSIFQDRSGVYWFGSEYDGVARWDGASIKIYTKKNGMSSNEVKVWLEDQEGNLWMGTDDGITVMPNGS
ncbi:ggdef family protein [hydrocarbon metagenome]|uniref:Ggdef family protein n=1 Tax=hydrocarbon metagenome TaxID=938273 RepID=A0A0W8E479_9ZZZZ